MTPDDVAAELAQANTHAQRLLAFDHLGRPNQAHAEAHQRLDALLDLWELLTAFTEA
jgi:hypothetical protein